MTIKEFSKSKGITPQAVYQKLKASGISISSIKEENTSELTESGIDILNGLFTKETDKSFNQTSEILKTIETLKLENRLLKEELEETRRQRDQWAAQAAEAQKTAQQAQALNLAAFKALPAPAEKRSLWDRLKGRK